MTDSVPNNSEDKQEEVASNDSKATKMTKTSVMAKLGALMKGKGSQSSRAELNNDNDGEEEKKTEQQELSQFHRQAAASQADT